MLKRSLKIFLYTIVGFLLLLILLGGLTQTHRFKDWLREEIVKQSAASLNGVLHLGRIEGNLVSRFGFNDICLILEGDTLLYVANLEVGLSPRELLKQQVLVSKLIFHAPQLFLRQRPDSTWNVAHLMKPNEQESSLELWRVALQNLEVQDGELALAPLDTSRHFLPRRLEHISTAMQLDYADAQMNVVLHNLRLKSLNPPLELDSLAAEVFWGGDSVAIENFVVRSDSSRLSGKIVLPNLARMIYEVELAAAPLHLDELRALLPNFPISGPLRGAVHLLGDKQNLRARFNLAHADGFANGNFFVFGDSAATHYHLETAVRALHLNPYLKKNAGATRLNGNITLDGSGTTLNDLAANLKMKLDSSLVLGREISQLQLTVEAHESAMQFQLAGNAAFGEIELSGKIIDPQQRQIFEVAADLRHLNLTKLLQHNSLDSDVSLHLAGAGRNFDIKRLQFDGWTRLAPSRVAAVLIDSAYCDFHFSNADLRLDTLRLASTLGNVHAGGRLSLNYQNDFRFRAELGDLTWVKRAMKADTLQARGMFAGTAQGPLDSLDVTSRFELQRVKYDRNFIQKLTGHLTFMRRDTAGGGFIQLRADKMLTGFLPIDSAKAWVPYDLLRAHLTVNFWQGLKNYGELEGLYTYGEVGRFDLSRAGFNVLGQKWQTPPDSIMWIDVYEEDYDFHHCELAYGEQRIQLDGRLSYIDAEDLRFKISGIDIASLAAMMNANSPSNKNMVTGILSGNGHLTGTAQAPVWRGSLNWDKGRVADFVFDKWETDFGYENERFSWQFRLHQNQDRQLTGDGYLPINLSLTNTGEVLRDDQPIRIQAATTGVDLAFLQTLTNRVKNVRGLLVFDIKFENTLKKPKAKGNLRIYDGRFSAPEFGVDYDDLQLVMTIDTSFVKIDQLDVRSAKGILKTKGNVNFAGRTISNAAASLSAKDFLVAKNKKLELRLHANITGSGDTLGARYRGDITVEKSRFFLQALQQREVIQLNEAPTSRADSASLRSAKTTNGTPLARWLQNLRGDLKISIPRNTWIRGPELNAEIEGALDFVQEGLDKFLPFGALNLIRGTYELFGKRFDIDEGQITFQGDLQNPLIALNAKHVFRTAGSGGEKKNLEIRIGGELRNPKIEFQQGDEVLDEKDALANLVFGVNFDELLYNQRDDLQQQTGSEGELYTTAAKGLVSGLVSQQLTKTIGRSLNLDLIEFQGGDDLSFMVGKYITNSLFVSFSQEPKSNVVTLEWEPSIIQRLKNFFLQASHGGEEGRKTGFDVIWKIDW